MVVDIIFAGILCCIAMDLWQRLLFVLYKIPSTNWAPIGAQLVEGILYKTNKSLCHKSIAIQHNIPAKIISTTKILPRNF